MNWTVEPLAALADFHLGKMLDGKKNRGDPMPYLANINVRWGEFDLSDLREMRFEQDEIQRYGLRYGDIVMCEGGEPGRCAVWKENLPGMMIQKALHRIRPRSNIHGGFLYYALLNLGRSGKLLPLFTGATIKHLPREKLAKVEIALPGLSEQGRIAETLAAYDDLIENNQRRMALIEEAERQLYREWFVRFRFPGHERTPIAYGVPGGWKRVPIADIADCIGGGTPSTSISNYWDDGTITWVTPTDVTRNAHYILLDSERKITEAGLQNSSAKLVPPHTILMTSRASLGFFAVMERAVCTNQGFISVVPKDRSMWPYLLLHLSSRVGEIRAMGSGSTYPEVSRSKFREFTILLPDRSLVTQFYEVMAPMFSQIRLLKQQNHRLRTARDMLLPRLMSGEIAA